MHIDSVFSALADPTRRAILARLAEGEATVDQLARPFDISQPAISRHLKVLENAGLISTRVDGSARPRRLNREAFSMLDQWLEGYRSLWAGNYARLDTLLSDLKDQNE